MLWMFIILLLGGMAADVARAGNRPPPRVLILHSYSPTFLWTRQEQTGILTALHNRWPDLDPAIEYMDWKANPTEENRLAFENLLRQKYGPRPPNLILTTDNVALDCALRMTPGALGEPPIVFCGISGYAQMATSLPSRVTGVCEAIDPAATLLTLERIQPEVTNVLIVLDGTESSQSLHREMEAIRPAFQNSLNFRFSDLEQLSLPQVALLAASLGPGDAVLMLAYNRDPDGTVYSHEQSVRRICGASAVPVYHCWDWPLGMGILGGNLMSGTAHGELAGQIAVRILEGTPPGAIPVRTRSLCPPMFDAQQLARFRIPERHLPPRSVVVNRTDTFFRQYRGRILLAVAVALALAGLNAGLVIQIRRGNRVTRQLRESEAKYRNLFDLESDALFFTDSTTLRILDANRAACLMYGCSRETLQTLKISDLSAEPERTAQSISRHDERVPLRWYQKADGTRFPVEITARFFEWQGRPMNLAAIRDISQRLAAERALQDERELFMAGPVVVFKWRPDEGGTVDYVSPNVETQFGYDPASLTSGRFHYTDLVHPDDRADLDAAADTQIATGRPWYEQEYRLRRADGRYLWVHDFTRVDHDSAGGVTRYHGYVMDISERKRIEAERQQMEARMLQSQKMESLGIMAGGIAHDFNNLLTGVLGNADLALSDVTPGSPVADSLREIVRAARRAAELCRQLLAYSGHGRFVIGPLDLSELVAEIAQMLEISISRKITLIGHYADTLPAVEADATQLRQVAMNLILNAAEAIGDGMGTITITTGTAECGTGDLCCESPFGEALAPGRYVYLEVADTGCGMDQPTMSRMFDPFFSTKFTGRGLGLPAVLGIVRGHGGLIKVDSEPGHGTSIRVLLPSSSKPAVPVPDVPGTSPLLQGQGKLLIVDDEPQVLELARKIVRRCGFEALAARSGLEAVEQFRMHHDDIVCVLLDLTMPGMDGDEVFRHLKHIRPDVRVILTSGYSEQDVELRFAGRGLSGFVQKPFTLAVLRGKLREVLNHGSASKPSPPAA